MCLELSGQTSISHDQERLLHWLSCGRFCCLKRLTPKCFFLKLLASSSFFFSTRSRESNSGDFAGPFFQVLSDNSTSQPALSHLVLVALSNPSLRLDPWENAPHWEVVDGTMVSLKLMALPIPPAFLHPSTYTWLQGRHRHFLLMTEYSPHRWRERYWLSCQGQSEKEQAVGHWIKGEVVSTS